MATRISGLHCELSSGLEDCSAAADTGHNNFRSDALRVKEALFLVGEALVQHDVRVQPGQAPTHQDHSVPYGR
jgi:hypothetical protein